MLYTVPSNILSIAELIRIIFSSNVIIGNEIKSEIEKENPIAIKVIDNVYKIQSIYDNLIYKPLTKLEKEKDEISTFLIRQYIIDILKKIYIIVPFINIFEKNIRKAAKIFLVSVTLPTHQSMVRNYISNLSKNINIVFFKAIHKFLLYLSYIDKKKYKVYHKEFELEMNIKPVDIDTLSRYFSDTLSDKKIEQEKKANDFNILNDDFVEEVEVKKKKEDIDNIEKEEGILNTEEIEDENLDDFEIEELDENVDSIKNTKTKQNKEEPFFKEIQYGYFLLENIEVKKLKNVIMGNSNGSHKTIEIDFLTIIYGIISFYCEEYWNIFNSSFIQYQNNFLYKEEMYSLQYKKNINACVQNFRTISSLFAEYKNQYIEFMDNKNIEHHSNSQGSTEIHENLEIQKNDLLQRLIYANNEIKKIFQDMIDKAKEKIFFIKDIDKQLDFNSNIYYIHNSLNGKTIQQAIIEAYCLALTIEKFLSDEKIKESIIKKITN